MAGNKETYKSQAEKKQEKPQAYFLDRATDILNALEFAEKDQAELTEAFRKHVTTEFHDPLQASVAPLEQENLIRLYNDLGKKREALATALNLVLDYVQRKQELTPVTRHTIRRALARYIVARHTYEELWNGKAIPDTAKLPPPLAEYVILNERESRALDITDRLLPFQYDVRDRVKLPNSVIPYALTPYASELALIAARRGITLEEVFGVQQDGSLRWDVDNVDYESIFRKLSIDRWNEKELQSLKLLVGFLEKHQRTIERAIQSTPDVKIEKLTIGEALDCCVGPSAALNISNEIVSKGISMLRGKIPHIRKDVTTILKERNLYAERATQLLLSPLTDLSRDQQERAKDMQEVVNFLFSDYGKVSIKNRDKSVAQHLSQSQKDIVEKLCEKVKTQEVREKLLRALLIAPDERTKGTGARIEAKLASLTAGEEISLQDAFQLYYFAEQGAAGFLPAAYKVLAILEKHDPNLASRAEARISGKFAGLILKAATNLPEALDELGMDDEVLEREVRNVTLYYKDMGLGEVFGLLDRIEAFHLEYPWYIVAPTDIAVGFSSAWGIRKGYMWVRVQELANFASLSESEVVKRYPKVPPATLKAARAEAIHLWTRYQIAEKRALSFFDLRSSRIRNTAITLIRAAKAEDIEKLAKALHKIYPETQELIPRIAPLTENADELRKLIQPFKYADEEILAALKACPRTPWILREIQVAGDAADAAGLEEQLARLSKVASEGDEAAKSALHGFVRARALGIGSAGLGFLANAFLIREKSQAMELETNPEKREVLRGEREELYVQRKGDFLLLAMTGPQAIVTVPLFIGETAFTKSLYDAARELATTPEEYQKLPSPDLLQKLKGRPIDFKNREHMFGHRESLGQLLWRKITGTAKMNEEKDAVRNMETEQINESKREDVLRAYEGKNTIAPLLLPDEDAEESEAKKRETEVNDARYLLVSDKMRYLARATEGTYYPDFQSEQNVIDDLENADAFAELHLIVEELQKHHLPLTLSYQADDGQEYRIGLEQLNASDRSSDILEQYRAIYKPAKAVETLRYASALHDGHNDMHNVRSVLFAELRHRIFMAEEKIRSGGVLWDSGEGHDRARLAIRRRLEEITDGCASALADGTLTPQVYRKAVMDAQKLLSSTPDQINAMVQEDRAVSPRVPNDGRYKDALRNLIEP